MDKFGEGLIEIVTVTVFEFVGRFESWSKDKLFDKIRELTSDAVALEVGVIV